MTEVLNKVAVVGLSYDEPNANDNWQILLRQNPSAIRVHGVQGRDSAFKRCANEAKNIGADFLCLVELDTVMNDDFFVGTQEQAVVLGDSLNPNATGMIIRSGGGISFPNLVPHNGLVYHFGSTKIFGVDWFNKNHTHEHHQAPTGSVDYPEGALFSFGALPRGATFVCKTEKQAFRAGFREGIKLYSQLKQGAPWAEDALHRWSSFYNSDESFYACLGTRSAIEKDVFCDHMEINSYSLIDELYDLISSDKEYRDYLLNFNNFSFLEPPKLSQNTENLCLPGF